MEEYNNQEKGGIEKMEKINSPAFREICPYCKREFIFLSENQVKYNLEAHKLTCKDNPSNLKNDSLKN